MIIITNSEHVEIVRKLRMHPKYNAYTTTQFSCLVRSLFPEYRDHIDQVELDQSIQLVIADIEIIQKTLN